MFEATILFCGTEDQKRFWIPLAQSGKVIGAYCQTELGHGTFVKGIETTAVLSTPLARAIFLCRCCRRRAAIVAS